MTEAPDVFKPDRDSRGCAMTYHHRPVTAADLDQICRHRHEMFQSSGRTDEILTPMTEAFRAWLQPRLANGDYFGWIVEQSDHAVASLGMMEIDWPPHPSHPQQARRGYILNVYVEPQHRGRGLAQGLMAKATDEARRRGLQLVILHATAMARPMYEQLGWTATSEMSITL
jgi:GNAT superfamily N-acetyltransferase